MEALATLAALRGEPYQLAGSLRPQGGARMIYSVIEHPCRRGRNRTATPTVRNVRAAPPPPSLPPPPPRAEDVYAPAAASLSSRGPGTALFLSCRHRRRRHYCYRRHTLPGLSFAPSIRHAFITAKHSCQLKVHRRPIYRRSSIVPASSPHGSDINEASSGFFLLFFFFVLAFSPFCFLAHFLLDSRGYSRTYELFVSAHADVSWFIIMTPGSHFHEDRSVPKRSSIFPQCNASSFSEHVLVDMSTETTGIQDYNTDMLFGNICIMIIFIPIHNFILTIIIIMIYALYLNYIIYNLDHSLYN